MIDIYGKDRPMTLKNETVGKCVLAYLALPTVVFLLGWLRWELGVPAGIAVLAALGRAFRRKRDDGAVTLAPIAEPAERLEIAVPVALALVAGIVAWCVLAGQGGFVVQSGDWNWRNATFRDLITHEWPVRYDDWNRALVFYVGHWLPPALVGKLVLAMTDSLPCAWRLGNVALLFWTATGVALVFSQLLVILKARSVRRQFAVLALLVFLGGLDVVGTMALNIKQMLVGLPPENSWWNFDDWWSRVFNYTSNSTCLFWVFHQAVPAWVATLFVARGARLSEVAFLLSLLAIYCPIPATGVAFAVCVLVLHRVRSGGEFAAVFRACVSLPNLVGVLVVAPLVAAFICSNPAAGQLSFVWTEMGTTFFLRRWTLFFVCELGLYFALTFGCCRRNPWWWYALVWLPFCPMVRIDGGADFCMRASIPAFLALGVLAFHSAMRLRAERSWKWAALVGCLVVGSYVPAKEMAWEIYHVCRLGLGVVVEDRIVTFDQDLEARFAEEYNWPGIGEWILAKNTVKSPDEQFFFRCLARPRADPRPSARRGRDSKTRESFYVK